MPTATTDPNAAANPADPNALQLAKPKTPPVAPGTPNAGAPPLTLAPAIPQPTVKAPDQPVDRVQLATDQFNTFAKATDPAYAKSLNDATSFGAARGQLGSGQLRTSYGDLALARQRDLDTERDTLLQAATQGSVADASTAYQQALSSAQQGLAQQLGTGNLTIAQQQANTAETGTLGSLGVQQGQLALAKTAQATGADQTQQQIDIAKKQADINAQYQAGTLTLAQKDQALRELAQQQGNTIATGQLDLAKTGQAADIAAQQAQIDLAKSGQSQQADQFTKSLAEQTAARLQQGSQFNASQAQSADQFKQSLAQNATQFGLSQEQAMALAKLNDATQNRSIDVSQAQGKNQLLVQLASILGGPTGNLNPDAIRAIALAFGVTIPNLKPTDTQLNGTTGNSGTSGDTGNTGGTGGTGRSGTGVL